MNSGCPAGGKGKGIQFPPTSWAHVEQVFVGFIEGGGVGVVEGVGAELLDEGEAVVDEGEIGGGEVIGVVEAGFVEVFDEILAVVGREVGVVDGRTPASRPSFRRRAKMERPSMPGNMRSRMMAS